ncbi:TPA: hypothetical protein U2I30_001686 [Providencia rettgeri]|nr:hypothetical protein [Providencia rettgeri]
MVIQPTVHSPTNAHYSGSLTTQQFYGLFDKDIPQETLDSLAKSSGEGNLNSIDLLHNLALRQDSVGKQAQNILFDLFSGKLPAKKGVDKEIQETSKVLYQSAHHQAVLSKPSKLLYIIGSALNNIADKLSLTRLFMEPDNIKPAAPKPLAESNLWCDNRMQQSDELYSNLISDDYLALFSVNYPLDISEDNAALLKTTIEEIKRQSNFLNKPEIFPINTGAHWVLFMLYHDVTDNKVKSFVFNSYHQLPSEIKQTITECAKEAGIQSDIEYIEGNIQENVPNGCGLFVIEAVKQLAETTTKNYVETLKNFKNNFLALPLAEQQQFNQSSRRQLYGNYHDTLYP